MLWARRQHNFEDKMRRKKSFHGDFAGSACPDAGKCIHVSKSCFHVLPVGTRYISPARYFTFSLFLK